MLKSPSESAKFPIPIPSRPIEMPDDNFASPRNAHSIVQNNDITKKSGLRPILSISIGARNANGVAMNVNTRIVELADDGDIFMSISICCKYWLFTDIAEIPGTNDTTQIIINGSLKDDVIKLWYYCA